MKVGDEVCLRLYSRMRYGPENLRLFSNLHWPCNLHDYQSTLPLNTLGISTDQFERGSIDTNRGTMSGAGKIGKSAASAVSKARQYKVQHREHCPQAGGNS
jgi:hypothetical protein